MQKKEPEKMKSKLSAQFHSDKYNMFFSSYLNEQSVPADRVLSCIITEMKNITD